MKIYFSLPKMSDLLKHDSPLLKVVGIGITAFVLLSSITVFAGFILHFTLNGWKLILYGFGIYPLLCLAPDIINLTCFTWFVRTLLKWNKLDQDQVSSGILMAVCLAISTLCTWYSFNLSQISAQQVADWMKPKIEIAAQLDSTLLLQSSSILNLDSLNNSDRTKALSIEQNAIVRIYDNQIKALVTDSLSWESGRKPTNTLWVNKQLEPIKKELTRLRYQRDTTLQRLALEYKVSTSNSSIVKDTITSLLISDAKQALIRKQKEQERKDNQHDFISSLISAIAGYAVLILLALGAVREILNDRNEIEPLPVIGPFDFQNFQQVKEVVFYPFVWMGRHIINTVRKWYKGLPELEEPSVNAFAYDYNVETKLVKIKSGKYSKIAAEVEPDKKPLLQHLKERGEKDDTKGESSHTKIVLDERQRICEHCKEPYIYNHKKQKYCSNDCRKEHWKIKNGREPYLKKKS